MTWTSHKSVRPDTETRNIPCERTNRRNFEIPFTGGKIVVQYLFKECKNGFRRVRDSPLRPRNVDRLSNCIFNEIGMLINFLTILEPLIKIMIFYKLYKTIKP